MNMYYVSRKEEILRLFEIHSQAWRPFLYRAYGEILSEDIIDGSRRILINLIPKMPYIGGDDNPMTRHIIRSSTSLALYKFLVAKGVPAPVTGKILYDAVTESVRQMPPDAPLTAEELVNKKFHARISQERNYPEDWV